MHINIFHPMFYVSMPILAVEMMHKHIILGFKCEETHCLKVNPHAEHLVHNRTEFRRISRGFKTKINPQDAFEFIVPKSPYFHNRLRAAKLRTEHIPPVFCCLF